MKNRLIEEISNRYRLYKDKILNEAQTYAYRKKRYGVDFTIAVFITTKNIDMTVVESNIRTTDRVILLEGNFIAIIFDFATVERGLKATENLYAQLEPTLFQSNTYIAVMNSSSTTDEDELVRKLFDLLIEEIENKESGVPEIPTI